MRGSLLIENEAARSSKADAEAYLIMAAIGALAGIVVAFARMPLHMPGHKVVWWMIPVLAARLQTRAPAGATTGASATALTTLALGGRIAGGFAMTPLVIVAGVILDAVAGYIERRRLSVSHAMLLFAAAGLAGNLVCSIKQFVDPAGPFFSPANLAALRLAIASYAFFGLLAGVCGAGAGFGISMLRAFVTRGKSQP